MCRREAVRCLGLLSMILNSNEADAVASSQRLALLRTALAFDSVPAVREVAAEAVSDLALSRCMSCLHPPFRLYLLDYRSAEAFQPSNLDTPPSWCYVP